MTGFRGGSETPPPDDSSYVPPGEGEAPTQFTGGRTNEADFVDIPVVMAGRISHASFDGVITARLSPDGTSYLVNTTYQRGNRKYYGFTVHDTTEGKTLWEHVFANTNYRSEMAFYTAGAKYIAAQAVDYDEEGEFNLLSRDGAFVMNRPLKGWTQPVVSDDGSWVALFVEKYHTLQVFGPPNLSPKWSAIVTQGARGFFLGDGPEMVLHEAGQARLMGGTGATVWTIKIPDAGHWNAALSPSGKYLAATTEDPDSTVYLYSVEDGARVWSQFLVAGGNKRLTFSPDGHSIVVYDVGQHGDIYMLDARTGEILWRFRLQGSEEPEEGATRVIAVEDLQFSPSGQTMTADIVETTESPDLYRYYHYLLVLTPDGRASWICPLGSDVDVDYRADLGLALVATNNPIEANGDVVNSVTLVSFAPEPAGGTGGESGGTGGP